MEKINLFNNSMYNLNKTRPTIGAFLDVLSDYNHQKYWKGLVAGAQEFNVNLLCFEDTLLSNPIIDKFSAQKNAMINLANNSYVDANIIWVSNLTFIVEKENFYDFFQKIKNDPESIKFRSIPEDIPVTIMNSYQGMKEIIEHLIKVHGCRRIAFIRGPEYHLGSIERYNSYIDTLAENNIPFDNELVSPPPNQGWIGTSGEKMMNLLLERVKNKLDAVVAVSDKIAQGAIIALQKKGIKVPQNIAITGFDDNSLAMTTIPAITTVNPQFEEIGRRSIEMFTKIINREKMILKQYVPHKFIIRQSCGCNDPAIAGAEVRTQTLNFINQNSNIEFNESLLSVKEKILSELKDINQSIISYNKLNELLQILIDELKKENEIVFISNFDEILHLEATENKDISIWHKIISTIRSNILPLLSSDQTKLKLDNLCQQARIMISQALSENIIRQQIYLSEQDDMLEKIEEELISIFDLNKLMDKLAEKLPVLGIQSCYLSLYEEKKFPYEWSKVMLAFNEEKRFEIESEGVRFSSKNLLPDRFKNKEKNFIFVIEPLYFHEEQLGFAMFEIGPKLGIVYEKLRSSISNAIKGAMLVKEMEARTQELDRANQYLKENQQKLYDMATKDPLTGVFSRRFFNQWLIKELRICLRSKQNLSLLLLDMDKLKLINDTVGHLAGDKALAIIGKGLMQSSRNTDFVCRYGGDEFAIILPQASVNQTKIICERISNFLKDMAIEGASNSIPISVSIGVSGVKESDLSLKNLPRPIPKSLFEAMAKSLIKKADESLYKAKIDKINKIYYGEELEWKL